MNYPFNNSNLMLVNANKVSSVILVLFITKYLLIIWIIFYILN